MAASYNCKRCSATLIAPTKEKMVPLILTHLRDHHGVMIVNRPELVELEASIRSDGLSRGPT